MGRIKSVKGQCGTCLFAKFLDNEMVHCISLTRASIIALNGPGYHGMKEIDEFGFMNLVRLELLAEESYRCPDWLDKKTPVATQALPERGDDSHKTKCPACGKEYDMNAGPGDDYTCLTKGIYRHVCGQLIKF